MSLTFPLLEFNYDEALELVLIEDDAPCWAREVRGRQWPDGSLG